jgi:hypothetical protein
MIPIYETWLTLWNRAMSNPDDDFSNDDPPNVSYPEISYAPGVCVSDNELVELLDDETLITRSDDGTGVP